MILRIDTKFICEELRSKLDLCGLCGKCSFAEVEETAKAIEDAKVINLEERVERRYKCVKECFFDMKRFTEGREMITTRTDVPAHFEEVVA